MVYKWTYLYPGGRRSEGQAVVELDRLDEVCGYSGGSRWPEASLGHGGAGVGWSARRHRGEMVRSVGLATIIQPPYSPELNPAERVFQEVRRWVEGRTYGSIDEKWRWLTHTLVSLNLIRVGCGRSRPGIGSNTQREAFQHTLRPRQYEMVLPTIVPDLFQGERSCCLGLRFGTMWRARSHCVTDSACRSCSFRSGRRQQAV